MTKTPEPFALLAINLEAASPVMHPVAPDPKAPNPPPSHEIPKRWQVLIRVQGFWGFGLQGLGL